MNVNQKLVALLTKTTTVNPSNTLNYKRNLIFEIFLFLSLFFALSSLVVEIPMFVEGRQVLQASCLLY